MTEIIDPQFYKDIAPDNVSFIILVKRLKASRIKNVSVDMLETFLFTEAQEPNTVIVKESLPNIAVITELFSHLGLNSVVHPVVEDYPAEQRQKDNKDPHWYNVTFSPAQTCSMVDCPLCYGELEMLNPRPQIVILGLPLDHYLTVEANKRYQSRRKKRLTHLKLMRLALDSITMTDAMFQSLDASADDDDGDDNYELGIQKSKAQSVSPASTEKG